MGLDPGIATVGFGIVDSANNKQKLVTCGVISTPAHTPLTSRLDQIYTDMEELIKTFHPDCMAIEELFFNTNITTGISVAQGRGVSLLCAFRCGLQICEYTPLQSSMTTTPLSVSHGVGANSHITRLVRPPRTGITLIMRLICNEAKVHASIISLIFSTGEIIEIRPLSVSSPRARESNRA